MPYSFSLHHTGWGCLAAAWSEAGLWELAFPLPGPEAAKNALLSPVDSEAAGEPVELLDQELKAYFSGNLTRFATVVDWNGYTAFQTLILRYTATIPYGEVRSYGEAALAAGSGKAARAAGGALHINRTPIIIPCHRVIGANGSLVGFGGGLDRKKALLALESDKVKQTV